MSQPRSSDALLERLDLQGKRVIDVGCGDGSLTRLMAGRGAHVLGLETSLRQLAKATAAPEVADEVYVEGGAESLPVSDASVDVVVFFNSLHHVPEMENALAEAARVLKPGGIVYASEPIAEGPFFDLCRPIDDETEVRARAHATLRSAARFGLEEESETVVPHTVELRNFEAFRERIISANQEREPIFKRMDAQMREAFQRLATPGANGFTFDQPTRANVLRKKR